MTLTKVLMELIGMTPVAMRQVMMIPIGINLGPQLLSNSQFYDMTIGAEVVPDPGFDTPASWNAGGNWVVLGGQATHTGGASSNLVTTAIVTTLGASYVAVVDLITDTANGSIEFSGRWADTNIPFDVIGSNTAYVAASGSNTPDKPTIRDKGSSSGTRVVDNFSVKPISLDDYSELGSRNVNDFMVFNADSSTVRIVSTGPTMGITQVIPDFVVGDYYYSTSLTDISSGSLKISTPGDGDLTTIGNLGENKGVISLTDSDIQIEANGACDVTASAFTLYRVI